MQLKMHETKFDDLVKSYIMPATQNNLSIILKGYDLVV